MRCGKLKILYISTVFPRPEQNSTIYTDLAEELRYCGHEIVVVTSDANEDFKTTQLREERGIKVLRVKTGRMYDVGILRKGISVVTLKFFLLGAMKKYLSSENFDFVLFETPPTTLVDVVKWAMKYFKCPSYLMLKDIFPQNALDIGLMKENNLVYRFFKQKEEQLYKTATVIGCMSDANKQYLLNHNKTLTEQKIEVFPNTKRIQTLPEKPDVYEMRKKYNVPFDAVVAIYGGNMGKPQGLDFFMEIIKSNREHKNVFFVLVGRGTERSKIKDFLLKEKISNAKLIDSLSRDDYEKLVIESDIGLIFLNKKFTIPNFPSRVLSYFEYGLPVVAATDKNTDFGEMIIDSRAGYWSEASDVKAFNENLNKLVVSKELRDELGLSGRRYLENNYDVSRSVKILEEFYSRSCK
jgi:glycosyltransferase involved in cell wall biosynthesis